MPPSDSLAENTANSTSEITLLPRGVVERRGMCLIDHRTMNLSYVVVISKVSLSGKLARWRQVNMKGKKPFYLKTPSLSHIGRFPGNEMNDNISGPET